MNPSFGILDAETTLTGTLDLAVVEPVLKVVLHKAIHPGMNRPGDALLVLTNHGPVHVACA